jgi:hypothetical protein
MESTEDFFLFAYSLFTDFLHSIADPDPEVLSHIAAKGVSVHCEENPIYVFFFWELRTFSPNFHLNVSVIYIFPGSVHIFPCSRTGRPILKIYKSLTDI